MSFKDHGKTYDSVFSREHLPGFLWLHERWLKFPLTELRVLSAEFNKASSCLTAIRTRNALILNDALDGLPSVRVPLPPSNLTHAWYKFYAFVKPGSLAEGWCRTGSSQRLLLWAIQLFLEAAVRFTWKSVSKVLVSHQLIVSPLLASLVKPALCFWCIPPLLLSRWRVM